MKRRLLLITLSLALLVLGINLIARGRYVSDKVQGRIVASARQALGFEVGMEGVVFNFFPSYVDIVRPYVRGWDKSDPKAAISAEKVRVYFSLPALLSKEAHIRRIQVEGPRVRVARLPGGGYNIDPLVENVRKSLEKKGGGGAGYKTEVDEVALFGADVIYADPQRGMAVVVTNGGVDFRLRGEDHYWVGLKVKDATVRRGNAPPIRMSFAGDVTWDRGKAKLEGVSVEGEGARLGAKGSVLWSKAPVLDLSVDARADLALLGRSGLWKDGPAGALEIKGLVKGAYPRLSGKGGLALRKIAYAGVDVGDIVSDVVFDKGAVTLPGLKCRLFGGTVEGSVAVDMGGEAVTYRSSWTLTDVISGYYTERVKALRFIPWHKVSGRFEITGRGFRASDIEAAGNVSLARYEAPHMASGLSRELDIIKAVSVDFGLKAGVVNVGGGTVRTDHCAVDFSGTVKLDGESDLTIKGRSSDVTDISTIIGYKDVHGNLDLTAYMRGNIVEPDIMGKAGITGAKAHGIPFQTAYGDVRLKNWRLSFTDFVFNQDKGSFLLNGDILFKGEKARFDMPWFHAKLGVRGVNARKIIAIFYDDIPVNLDADGELVFDGNTEKFGGHGSLTTGAGDVYGQRLDKGEVDTVLTERDISFPKVVAVRDRDILTASGGIGFDGTFHGKATSAKVNLTNFDLLMGTGLPIKGGVSVSVTGGGRFDHPDIDATLSAYRLYYKDVDLGEGSLNVSIKGDVLTGSGAVLGDKVYLDGSLGLRKPYRWRGRLKFNEGRFEPFVKLIYKDMPEDVSFVSTGVFTGEGAIDEPGKESFTLDFKKVSAEILGRRLENVGDIGLAYKAGALTVKSLKLQGESLGLEVTGGAEGLGSLDLEVSAQADMSAFKQLAEESIDYIAGTCRVKLAVRGDLKDPDINGRVSVNDAGLKFKDFPQRFDNINAEADLDRGGFTLKTLKAELGGGKVTARGKGSIKGYWVEDFSIQLNAEDAKVKYPENLAATVDASLSLEGAGRQRSVGGEVTIKKARYSERVDWKSWLLQFQKGRKEVEASEPGPLGDTALNVHITGRESIKMDNNLAKIPVSTDLYVRGTIARPVFLGRLEASKGQVYFRNNEFRLLNGVAEFADPTRLNPIIDLQAETKVKEYMIQLTLSGTLDRIKVALLSDPPLEDPDIITLLTIGRTTAALKGHETAVTTGEAASYVTGPIQDVVEERVRRVTGFDRFQIDPYLTSSGASSGPRVTVGKSLFSDKLYITYSSNLGTSEDQFVRLEYKITDNLSLVGERDELGRVGGDIKYRFEFK